MRDLKNDLKQLVETCGVSGFEQEVRQLLCGRVMDACDALWEDAYGNLIARIGPQDGGYKVGVYAHMDEVGLLVSKVTAQGQLGFELMGMIDERILPGSQVIVCTADGKQVTGVIGNKSKHLQTGEDQQAALSYKKMTVDVGAASAQEVAQMGIRVGCPISFATKCTYYPNGTVLAKSLDDRIGCLTLQYLLQEVYGKLENITLYGFFTVQEEVGARGAASVAQGLGLDMFITLDTVPVLNRGDLTPGDLDLGDGPVIRLSDAMPQMAQGMISHPSIVQRMVEVAQAQQLPYTTDVVHSTYLDSCTAQFTDNGIPGGSLCFPRRYSHTGVEMSNLRDIDQAITLLRETVLSLDRDPIRFGRRYK